MTYMRFATSDELLMRHIKEDPEAVMYAFDVIAQDAALLSELLITQAGCDGIYYCVQNAELNRFTYAEYRKYVTPSDKFVLEHANKFSDNNILHCCGWAGDKNRMEVWQDYPAKVFNWAVFVENMNLTEGKKFFNGKCVLGGFDNRPDGVLCSGTQAEVEVFTEKLIKESGKIGIVIGADCTLPREVDKQKLRWVIEKSKAIK
jgi:uroporphyrinogen decarboxylase